MPYVLPEKRPELNRYINKLVELSLNMEKFRDFLICLSGSLTFQPNHPIMELVNDIHAAATPDGNINYILFKYAKYHIKPSYNNYKNFMGMIYEAVEKSLPIIFKNEYRESAEWIRIKLLIPYEEQKIIENGDI
jgi:hypothetical protein